MPKSYDYIIVGGGSAGCVLANRLSANPSNQVCLLEAGPNDWLPLIHLPAGIIPVIRSSTWNWSYWTKREKHLNNRKMYWPRGRTLGGSSAINAMVATRGLPADYDDWAALGCEGWDFAACLPYFRRYENFTAMDDIDDEDQILHGQGGPLNVTDLPWRSKVGDAFIEAGQQAGYPYNNDFTGWDYYGVGPYRVYQKDGKRCSNATAYLSKKVRNRKNLKIITGAQATRILSTQKLVTGVEYQHNHARHIVNANKEVIVCGGAVNSPQLLLLSGIGATAKLTPHGIKSVHDLPGVGENLQDHLDISIIVEDPSKSSVSLHPWYLLTRGIKAFFKYLFSRTGELTSNIAEAGGFIKTDDSEERADIQLHLCNVIEQEHGHNLKLAIKKYGYTLRCCDLRPLSRGSISLQSKDPLDPARIQPNYGTHERDIDKLVTAVKKGREILQQEAMQPYLGQEIEPGKEIQTDSQIRKHVLEKAETIYHPVGTCKMGPADDPMAVVDCELKVHGMQRLRVVDASIMPTLIGGNTNGPTTMIAEKAAEMILRNS